MFSSSSLQQKEIRHPSPLVLLLLPYAFVIVPGEEGGGGGVGGQVRRSEEGVEWEGG